MRSSALSAHSHRSTCTGPARTHPSCRLVRLRSRVNQVDLAHVRAAGEPRRGHLRSCVEAAMFRGITRPALPVVDGWAGGSDCDAPVGGVRLHFDYGHRVRRDPASANAQVRAIPLSEIVDDRCRNADRDPVIPVRGRISRIAAGSPTQVTRCQLAGSGDNGWCAAAASGTGDRDGHMHHGTGEPAGGNMRHAAQKAGPPAPATMAPRRKRGRGAGNATRARLTLQSRALQDAHPRASARTTGVSRTPPGVRAHHRRFPHGKTTDADASPPLAGTAAARSRSPIQAGHGTQTGVRSPRRDPYLLSARRNRGRP